MLGVFHLADAVSLWPRHVKENPLMGHCQLEADLWNCQVEYRLELAKGHPIFRIYLPKANHLYFFKLKLNQMLKNKDF
jgi:hypothetical protein